MQNSHVLPALIRKFHEAKINQQSEVMIWGDGSPLREFMHVDDLAEALVHLMLHYNDRLFMNAGTGVEITIKDLALLIKKITEYSGELVFDSTKPNGTPRKLMDISRLRATGFEPKITLEEGIRAVYEEYKQGIGVSIR